MTDTTVIPGASDNGDGTWTSTAVTDNGDGTWTATGTGPRDIDMTAGPIFTDWAVMGVTANPMSAGPVGNNDYFTTGPTTGSTGWTASPITTDWTAGPIWIEE